jgi:hypothetical protein
VNAEITVLQSTIEELEQSRSEQSTRIDSLARVQRELETSLEKAHAKIGEDEQLLERARRAVTIGLSLLEDQKGNVLKD